MDFKKVITLGFVISSQLLVAAAPQFNIPGLNIPVTCTIQKYGAEQWLEPLIVGLKVESMYRRMGGKKVIAECGKAIACMHIMNSTNVLCHEFAHAVVAKYCLGDPQIMLDVSTSTLVRGILSGKVNIDYYPPVMPVGKSVKESLGNFIQVKKNIDRNLIVMSIAGPMVGIAVSGTLGYMLKDYFSIAPSIGFLCILQNVLGTTPFFGSDGSNILAVWQGLQALREIEKDFNALPENQEVTQDSEIFQRALKL